MRSALHPAILLFLCTSLWLDGCKEDKESLATGPDGGAQEDGGLLDAALPSDAGATLDGDCYTNPTRHLEIINACTAAERVDKHPVLPLLLLDGGLPPLP